MYNLFSSYTERFIMFDLEDWYRFILNGLLAMVTFIISSRHDYVTNYWEDQYWGTGGYLFLVIAAETLLIVILGLSLWWLAILLLTIVVGGIYASMISDAEFADEIPGIGPPKWMLHSYT